MKTRSSAFVLGLHLVLSVIFAGAAQGQNCSIGTMIPGPITGTMPCLEEQEHIWSYNQTKTFTDTCTNTQTGAVYSTIPSSVTSAGQCLDSAGDLLDCPVIFANNSTNGTGPGDYNRFYNQAYPQTIKLVGGYLVCVKGVMVQDFQQCACAACTCTGSPGFVCATGAGDGGETSPTCSDGSWTCNGATECETPPSQYTCSQGEYGSPSCGPSGWYCYTGDSPIIIDTTGTGFHLTDFQDGVNFDITGNGKPQKISWTAPGSTNGWLTLPHDGKVTTGKELFGNFTPQPPSENPNGFLALAVYDLPENGGNGDGVIDWHDAVWPKLRIWIDKNHDGIAQPDELFTLPSLGVNSLALAYVDSRYTDNFGNQFRYKGRTNPDGAPSTDRVNKTMYDVFLLSSATKAKRKPQFGKTDNDLAVDHQLR
jgi:hypothetical protein